MKTLCYGEILWDIAGEKKTIGGAPFNVSGHFSRLGDESYVISALGNDELGHLAFSAVSSIGVRTTFLKFVPYDTGCAYVTLKEGIPSYSFNTPSAWDNITITEEQFGRIREEEYDVFVFGTLSQRSSVSHETLKKLLDGIKAKEMFFDVNLRLNFYSKDIIEEGLSKATILKLNDEESDVILKLLNLNNLSSLLERYENLKMIIYTCGGEGSVVITRKETYTSKPEKINVVDTVGAGDSFSATFLHFLIKGNTIPEAMTKATTVASFVVQQPGAIPVYSNELKSAIFKD